MEASTLTRSKLGHVVMDASTFTHKMDLVLND